MSEDRFPMSQDEITQIVAILNRENTWVRMVRYPGTKPGEIGVDCHDGKSWRICRPIHLVRLKYRYCQAS